MNPQIAAAIFACGILGLFVLDRDPKARTSWALWIPMAWLSIGGSRVVSEWLNPTAPDVSNPYVEGNPLDRNIQTALLILALIVLVRRGPQVGRLLRANTPILLFFVYCGVSTLWSDFPDVTFRRWVKAIGDVVMVMVALTDRDRLAAIKFPARVGFILIPASILLIRYYPNLARGYDDITGEATSTGVTTSKNSLGMICLIFGLASVWSFLLAYRGERKGRIGKLTGHGVLIAMMLWLFLGAHSMTSLSCFVLAIGLIAATSLSRVVRRPVAVHLLVAAVVLISFSVLFLGIGGGLLQTMGRNSSLTGRTEIWRIVLGMDRNPLLGTGFESFWLGERLRRMWETYRGINQAHNGYIEVYLNLGCVGICLLITVLLTGYRSIVSALRQDPELGRFRLAYFVVGVVYNFTEGAFKMMSPIWIMFLLAVMAVPRVVPRKRSSVSNARAGINSEHKTAADPALGLERIV